MQPIRPFLALVAACALLVLGVAAAWNWLIPRPIPEQGGLFFPLAIELDVPLHRQADPVWAADLLGPTTGTLGAEGCAVACASMVLAFHGADVDPGQLNQFVHDNEGYTPQGWIYWEAAAEYPPARLEKAYEHWPSYAMLDLNLLQGQPSIVRIRFPSGITHFVVVMGKQGFDYLIRDPLAEPGSDPESLAKYAGPIEALRFYREK